MNAKNKSTFWMNVEATLVVTIVAAIFLGIPALVFWRWGYQAGFVAAAVSVLLGVSMSILSGRARPSLHSAEAEEPYYDLKNGSPTYAASATTI